jgi:cobalt-zinc-cadmium efflux system outer membrane protein
MDITRADLEDFIRVGKAQVQEAYLLTAISQKKASLAREQVDYYYRIREIHRKRFEAGDVSGLSQMRIDLEELRFLSALNEARTDFHSAWSELAALIGWMEPVPASLQWEPKPREVTPSLEQLKELAVRSRPDLASLSLQEKQMLQLVEFEKAQRIPDLTLGGGYKKDFEVNSFYASVTLPLPLFDRNQGALKRASAELRRAGNQFLWRKLQIRFEVERSYRNYREQQDTVARVERDLLQAADTVLETTRASYEAGESSLTDYLDALRVSLEASVSFYDLLLQLEQSRIQLEHAVGVQIK